MDKIAAAEIAEYIQVTSQTIEDLNTSLSALRQENQALKQVQKSASDRKVDPAEVGSMLDRIVEAGFILPSQKEASFRAVLEDTGCLVPFLEKLASNAIRKEDVVLTSGKPEDAQKAPQTARVRESDRFYEGIFG